ncbi:MAG: MltA domain-containing protein [Planctomycetota bacterium]|nr:MltA domain-containing protein [Planctomycetota bacterium]
MKRSPLVGLAFVVLLGSCKSSPDYSRELAPGMRALILLDADEIPDFSGQWAGRDAILPALEESILWTRREHAKSFFPIEGITHERAIDSLLRFREVLQESLGPDDFQRAIEEEFTVYVSAGWNGKGGGVLFTAYCTPILRGSLDPDAKHRYPLYAPPLDLEKARDGSVLGWRTAGTLLADYPSRRAIEAGGLLEGRGLEVAWLADPIDAYIAHINGSAFIELEDGSMLRLGNAGTNGRAYNSLGRELEADGQLERASLQAIRDWAAAAPPEQVEEYLFRNPRYAFFRPIDGNPHGSLDVEVTAEHSLATDKALFPRGAIVFVEADVPATGGASQPFAKFMLDQDTGGAIRSAGRADIYLGIGPDAEERAGRTKSEGQLYYLFLRE